MSKGPHAWDGTRWIPLFYSLPTGTEGQVLTWSPNNKAEWMTPLSTYKVTGSYFFDSNNYSRKIYSYAEMTSVGTTNNISRPAAGFAANDYIYTLPFTTTTKGSDKVISLSTTISVRTVTVFTGVIMSPFWHRYYFKVKIGDQDITLPNQTANGMEIYFNGVSSTTVYFPISVDIPIPANLPIGANTLKVQVLPVDNFFKENQGTTQGKFSTSEANFLYIGISTLSALLYEK